MANEWEKGCGMAQWKNGGSRNAKWGPPFCEWAQQNNIVNGCCILPIKKHSGTAHTSNPGRKDIIKETF